MHIYKCFLFFYYKTKKLKRNKFQPFIVSSKSTLFVFLLSRRTPCCNDAIQLMNVKNWFVEQQEK